MNEQERAELEQLKKRQAELAKQLLEFSGKIAALEARLTQPRPAETPKPAAQVPPNPVPPLIPPVIVPVAKPVEAPVQPPRPPPVATPKPAEAPLVVPQSEPVFFATKSVPAQPPPLPQPPKPAPRDKSLEMRVGTYWLVRVGIVMLLTSLVFLATYAYQHLIVKFGAGGRLALLYVASGALLAVGAWLHRKEEKLRNYAQVLFAGGLAAVYFTTYAAHYVPQLAVIRSPSLDGLLLLAWAGFMVWIADRKKSEVLAVFAVLLAYYTSIITHVGLFTLYSNLILTAAAVFFLVRNRWVALSFASLVATYIAYGFWRFYQDGVWQLAGPDEGLWTGNFFLMGYWALFTVAAFLTKHEQTGNRRRTTFLSLNNAAFFAAFLMTMLQVRQHGFWKFSLIYGSALVALSALAVRLRPNDRLFQNAYLTQGLLLVTLGFVSHYSGDGPKLSLVLAFESAALAVLGQQLKSRVMQVAGLAAGMLAVSWGLVTIAPFNRDDLIKGTTVGALMLFNAFWLRKETTFEHSASHFRTVFFTVLSLAIWLVTTWQNESPDARGLAIACECVAFLVAARPLGNQVLRFGAYVFALIAVDSQLAALGVQYGSKPISERIGLVPGIIIGTFMVFNALWEQRKLPPKPDQTLRLPTAFFSVMALVTWLMTTWVFCPREYLAPLLAIETAAFTAAYCVLRLKELSLFGQFFLFTAHGLWLYDAAVTRISRPWWNPALIIIITLAMAHWWQRQKTLLVRQPVSWVIQGIAALAVVGVLNYWFRPHFGPSGWLAFTSLLAVLVTAWAAINRFWLLAAAGQLFLLVSCWKFAVLLWDGKPEWHLALAPIAVLVLLAFCTIKWFERHPGAKPELREPILQIGFAYRVVAVMMSLWWIHKYIPAREICWALVALGLLLFAVAGWRRNQELLIFSAIFTVIGIWRFWLPMENAMTVYLPNLVAIIALLAQQRMTHRLPEMFRVPRTVQTWAIVLGGLSVWGYLSRWMMLQQSEGIYLTAGWSCLALIFFVAGMTMRERVYRWLGLGVLACALGRVVFFDVWELETIYRVLSFMALGIVLLVLGFLYTKYQEKIKEWL